MSNRAAVSSGDSLYSSDLGFDAQSQEARDQHPDLHSAGSASRSLDGLGLHLTDCEKQIRQLSDGARRE